jgi:crossover junction endodeoxyribonuclease RuvC
MTIQPSHGITTPMIIMGVDPGTARVGWSIIEVIGSVIKPTAYGCIETLKDKNPETRLEEIYDAMNIILTTYKPDCMAVEDLFFSSNAKTAIAVGQSRGIILLAASKSRVPVISYSPLTIKRTITGDGNADKKQMTRMVVLTLRLKEAPKLDDTADALAIAMTHAYSYKIKKLI